MLPWHDARLAVVSAVLLGVAGALLWTDLNAQGWESLVVQMRDE